LEFKLKSIIVLFFIVFLLSGCKTNSEYLKIENEYAITDLVRPVASLDLLLLSTDYFDRFFYSDNNDFARIFYEYSVLKYMNFKDNQSVTLKITDYLNDDLFLLKTLYRGKDEEGNEQWLFLLNFNDRKQFFEMKNHSVGIPLSFRFLDRDSNEYYEKIPISATVFQKEMMQMGEENFIKILNAGRDTLFLKKSEELFNSPQNIGVEIIDTEIGPVGAVHFYDSIKGKGEVDYWINNNVPGSIVKVIYRDDSGSIISEIEIIGIDNKSKEIIPDLSQKEQPPYDRGVPGLNNETYSEGTVNEPHLLTPGIAHYGSVMQEDTSYYSVSIDRQSRVDIEVNNVHGKIELKYFGTDQSFTMEDFAAQLNTQSITDHLVDSGSTLYFSISDNNDRYIKGEFYKIDVHVDSMLPPESVLAINRIHEDARELIMGNKYRFSMNDNSLNYFKTSVGDSSNLQISVVDNERRGRLFWYETQKGNYQNAEYIYENGQHILIIRGITDGATCYYYYCQPSSSDYTSSDMEINVKGF